MKKGEGQITRIQRKRTKGWRMPEGAVYVGRPTRWGNPYPWGPEWGIPYGAPSRETVTDCYRQWLEQHPARESLLEPLRKASALVCWCPLVDAAGDPVPCHADVLIELLADG